ncbi:envelope poly [Labeo rohita]|uniref:Envelope poly n=1 Tax=Labeo rohita TaxID=84645 RepID=A0A498M9U8_LABRO|nr:envelope poly [Labeo rohita]
MEQQKQSWHLMRHPVLCALRATTCALIVLSLWIVLPLMPQKGSDPEPVISGTASVKHALGPRRVREMPNDYAASFTESWMDHPSPSHPYATNMWWRVINHTVKQYGSDNCYVCAQFAQSTTAVDWWPYQDRNTATIMAVMAVAAAAFNDSSTLWYTQDEEWRQIKVMQRLFGQVAIVQDIPTNLTCYSRVTGTHPLGKIPKSNCNMIYEENETNLATRRRCLRCLNKGIVVAGPLGQSAVASEYLFNDHCARTRCEAACALVHVPDEEGTGVVENTYWQCGYEVYTSLPRNWTGTCALIQLHGGTIVLPHQPREIMRRKKGGLLNVAQESQVPKNAHIWNIAEKLLAVIIPGTGVASLMQEVQVARYDLISFINMTKMMEGVEKELRGLMLADLQNRFVLDLLLAERSGVCVTVEETCCTYIPENDKDGRVIKEALANLTFMAKTVTDWEANSETFGWGWFTKVTNLIVMAIWMVCLVLLILCLCRCMTLIRNAVSSAFQHQMVHDGLPYLYPKPENYAETDSSFSSCEDDTETDSNYTMAVKTTLKLNYL